MAYLIIALLALSLLFIGAVIGATLPVNVDAWQLIRPAVVVEEMPEDGTAFLIIEAPRHANPISHALIFDGDTVRMFKEERRL